MAITIQINMDDRKIDLAENELSNSLLFLINKELFLINKAKDATTISILESHKLLKEKDWSTFLQTQLLPLSKVYDIHFDEGLVEYKSTSSVCYTT